MAMIHGFHDGSFQSIDFQSIRDTIAQLRRDSLAGPVDHVDISDFIDVNYYKRKNSSSPPRRVDIPSIDDSLASWNRFVIDVEDLVYMYHIQTPNCLLVSE